MAEPTFNRQRLLERITTFTPLGIRFWDPVRNTQVSDGLTVTARPETLSGSVTRAFRTASGIYTFQGLQGLHDVEYPEEDTVIASSPPQTTPFIIEVQDQLQRFLPVVFRIELPLPYRGIFPTVLPNSPPGGSPRGFYLFSAPTRSAAPGLAAVRGCLVEAFSRRPAAHAVLEVEINNGATWYGIADERGCIAVLFPYPTVRNVLGTSPPGMLQTPLLQQRWDSAIRVRYSPVTLAFTPGATTPDLRSILNQAPGGLWPTQTGPPFAELSVTLHYGQELVVRTDNLSVLVLSPGASPP
jgi:hypothetical protein